MKYFKEFKIDCNKLKRIDLIETISKSNLKHIHKANAKTNNNNTNNDILLQNLFSFYNIENNLTHLNIALFTKKTLKIQKNLIEQLNNFKSLSILYLSGIFFENDFMIKLTNLKKLFFQILKIKIFLF
jgi:hypothetical protein